MGLGKTIEVLSLLVLTVSNCRNWKAVFKDAPAAVTPPSKPRGGTLIVCPVTLFGQWRQEIRGKMKDSDHLSIYEYRLHLMIICNRRIEMTGIYHGYAFV